MSDKIILTNLRVRGVIGIYDWERKDKQDMVINGTFYVDITKPALSDKMEDGVNYRSISKRLIAIAETLEPQLIEHLLDVMARALFNEFEIERMLLRVDKPGALRFADSIGVEIDRSRQDYLS